MTESLKLHTLVCSTRPGRLGLGVGQWFHGLAAEHGSFQAELVDLAAFDLPVFDEPHYPILNRYEHGHTKRLSGTLKEADAFVFVAPEYNSGPSPALVNALSYLAAEWHYKPAAFVTYGAGAGGSLGAGMVKPILTALRMMPIPECVSVPMIWNQLSDGVFQASDQNRSAAATLLAELHRWAGALKPLRG
ncbi:MAG TPA: NAD(P)H-dependent oxidoreductase [Microvirga sp.]|nr:NAD(P)H-dependent oxidoreductase [Microvirga sp.]